MPTYTLEDPQGRQIDVEGDREPNQSEIAQLFAQAFPAVAASPKPKTLAQEFPDEMAIARPNLGYGSSRSSTLAEMPVELAKVGGDVAVGASQLASGGLKTIGAVSDRLAQVSPVLGSPIDLALRAVGMGGDRSYFTALGERIQQGAQALPQGNPEDFSTAFNQGMGQMGAAVATGGAAGLVGATPRAAMMVAGSMGFGAEFDDAMQRAVQRGDSPDTALTKALAYATGSTAIENWAGAGRVFRKLFPSPEVAAKVLTKWGISKEIIGNFLAGYGEEASQRVLQNAIVAPEEGLLTGANQEGLVGALVQGPVATIGLAGRNVPQAQEQRDPRYYMRGSLEAVRGFAPTILPRMDSTVQDTTGVYTPIDAAINERKAYLTTPTVSMLPEDTTGVYSPVDEFMRTADRQKPPMTPKEQRRVDYYSRPEPVNAENLSIIAGDLIPRIKNQQNAVVAARLLERGDYENLARLFDLQLDQTAEAMPPRYRHLAGRVGIKYSPFDTEGGGGVDRSQTEDYVVQAPNRAPTLVPGMDATVQNTTAETSPIDAYLMELRARAQAAPAQQVSTAAENAAASEQEGGVPTVKAGDVWFRGHASGVPFGTQETFLANTSDQAKPFASQTGGQVSEIRFKSEPKIYPAVIPWQEYQSYWRNSGLLKGFDAVPVEEPNGQSVSLAVRNKSILEVLPVADAGAQPIQKGGVPNAEEMQRQEGRQEVEPITPAQGPIPKPVQSEAKAETGGVRSKTLEQMTPEEFSREFEWVREKGGKRLYLKSKTLLLSVPTQKNGKLLVAPEEAIRRVHSDWINSVASGPGMVGAKELRPSILASSADTYGIKLPSGYVREGDLYVYKPLSATAPTVTSPVVATPEPPATLKGAGTNARTPERGAANVKAPATISDNERKAIEFSNDPNNLKKRLSSWLEWANIADRKSWKLDAANKRMVSPDGKRAAQWMTRKLPDEPESYENQQTSEGTAKMVSLEAEAKPSATISPLRGTQAPDAVAIRGKKKAKVTAVVPSSEVSPERAAQMLSVASRFLTEARLNYIIGEPRQKVLDMKLSKAKMQIVQQYWDSLDAVERAKQPASASDAASPAAAVAPEIRKSENPAAKQRAPFDAKAAKAQKKFLLEEVDKAIAEAPADYDFDSTPQAEDLKLVKRLEALRDKTTLTIEDPELLRRTLELTQKYGVETRQKKSDGTEGDPHNAYWIAGQLEKRLTEDAYKAMPHVTIEVPGDGTFDIINNKQALEKFKERAKNFPTTPARAPQPRVVRTEATTATAGDLSAENVTKAAEMFLSDDAGRPPLHNIWSDGKQSVATDGRRLILIEKGLGGTEKSPVLIKDGKITKINPKASGDGKVLYPNWRQVIPDDSDLKPFARGIDVDRMFSLLKQAEQVMDTDKSATVVLMKNKDGSVGIYAHGLENGDYSSNIQPFTDFTAGNVFYLQDIMRAAKRLGIQKLDIDSRDELSPMVFRGPKLKVVLMPMRMDGLPDPIGELHVKEEPKQPKKRGAKPVAETTANPALDLLDSPSVRAFGLDYTRSKNSGTTVSPETLAEQHDAAEGLKSVAETLGVPLERAYDIAAQFADETVTSRTGPQKQKVLDGILGTRNAPADGLGLTVPAATTAITEYLGVSELPDRISVSSDPNAPYGGYYRDGRVVVNAPQTTDAVKTVLEEGMHGVWGLPEVQGAWNAVLAEVTDADIADERARRGGLDTRPEVLREEAAIAKVLANKPGVVTKLLDAIRKALNKLFGTNLQASANAQILEAARKFLLSRNESLPGKRVVTNNAIITAPGMSVYRNAITAHHGTPHKVDRFSTSKIGTGEGAQVYGWGIYFADRQEVAEDYRNRLATGSQLQPDGSVIDKNGRVFDKSHPYYAEALLGVGQPQGNTYTVRLKVEPEDLLDWDERIGEYDSVVKRINSQFEKEFGVKSFWQGTNPSGQWLYATVAKEISRRKGKLEQNNIQFTQNESRLASEFMSRAGIRGIRYLDQGSRPIAEPYQMANGRWNVRGLPGDMDKSFDSYAQAKSFVDSHRTYNYVIFDDADIEITHENGKPVTMAEAMGGETRYAPGAFRSSASVSAAKSNPWTDASQQSDIENLALAQASLFPAELRSTLETRPETVDDPLNKSERTFSLWTRPIRQLADVMAGEQQPLSSLSGAERSTAAGLILDSSSMVDRHLLRLDDHINRTETRLQQVISEIPDATAADAKSRALQSAAESMVKRYQAYIQDSATSGRYGDPAKTTAQRLLSEAKVRNRGSDTTIIQPKEVSNFLSQLADRTDITVTGKTNQEILDQIRKAGGWKTSDAEVYVLMVEGFMKPTRRDGVSGYEAEPLLMNVKNLGDRIQRIRDLRTTDAKAQADVDQFQRDFAGPAVKPKAVSPFAFARRYHKWMREHEAAHKYAKAISDEYNRVSQTLDGMLRARDAIEAIRSHKQYRDTLGLAMEDTDARLLTDIASTNATGVLKLKDPIAGTEVDIQMALDKPTEKDANEKLRTLRDHIIEYLGNGQEKDPLVERSYKWLLTKINQQWMNVGFEPEFNVLNLGFVSRLPKEIPWVGEMMKVLPNIARDIGGRSVAELQRALMGMDAIAGRNKVIAADKTFGEIPLQNALQTAMESHNLKFSDPEHVQKYVDAIANPLLQSRQSWSSLRLRAGHTSHGMVINDADMALANLLHQHDQAVMEAAEREQRGYGDATARRTSEVSRRALDTSTVGGKQRVREISRKGIATGPMTVPRHFAYDTRHILTQFLSLDSLKRFEMVMAPEVFDKFIYSYVTETNLGGKEGFKRNSKHEEAYRDIAKRLADGEISMSNIDDLTEHVATFYGTEATPEFIKDFQQDVYSEVSKYLASAATNIVDLAKRGVSDVKTANVEGTGAQGSFVAERGRQILPYSFYQLARVSPYERAEFRANAVAVQRQRAVQAIDGVIKSLQQLEHSLNEVQKNIGEKAAAKKFAAQKNAGEIRFTLTEVKDMLHDLNQQKDWFEAAKDEFKMELASPGAKAFTRLQSMVAGSLLFNPAVKINNIVGGSLVNNLIADTHVGAASHRLFGPLSNTWRGTKSLANTLRIMAELTASKLVKIPELAALERENPSWFRKVIAMELARMRRFQDISSRFRREGVSVLPQPGQELKRLWKSRGEAVSDNESWIAARWRNLNQLMNSIIGWSTPLDDRFINLTNAAYLDDLMQEYASKAFRIVDARGGVEGFDPADPAQFITAKELGITTAQAAALRQITNPIGSLEYIMRDYVARSRAAEPSARASVPFIPDEAVGAVTRAFLQRGNLMEASNSPAYFEAHGMTGQVLGLFKKYVANMYDVWARTFATGHGEIRPGAKGVQDWLKIKMERNLPFLLLVGAAAIASKELFRDAIDWYSGKISSRTRLANVINDPFSWNAARYLLGTYSSVAPMFGNYLDSAINTGSLVDASFTTPLLGFTASVVDAGVNMARSGDVVGGVSDLSNRYMPFAAPILNRVPPFSGYAAAANATRALRAGAPSDIQLRESSVGGGGGTARMGNQNRLGALLRRAESAAYTGDRTARDKYLDKAVRWKMENSGLTERKARKEVESSFYSRTPEAKAFGRKLTDTERGRVESNLTGRQLRAYRIGAVAMKKPPTRTVSVKRSRRTTPKLRSLRMLSERV